MKHMYVNGKFLSQKISGVQRYASQLLQQCYQLDQDITIVAPESRAEASSFHLSFPVAETGSKAGLWWEQVQLPWYASRRQSHCCSIYVIWRLCCILTKSPVFMISHFCDTRISSRKLFTIIIRR